MNRLDHLRRLAALALVAAFLVLVPGIASAVFTGERTASVKVETASLSTPTGFKGTFTCSSRLLLVEGVTVKITDFSTTDPAGTSYSYQLFRNGTAAAKDTATSSPGSRAAELSGSHVSDGKATEWTIQVTPSLQRWVANPARFTITCDLGGRNEGSL